MLKSRYPGVDIEGKGEAQQYQNLWKPCCKYICKIKLFHWCVLLSSQCAGLFDIFLWWYVNSYLLSIDTAAELEEYLTELLDITVPSNKNFMQELFVRWRQQNGKKSCEPVTNSAKVCLILKCSHVARIMQNSLL